MILSTDRRTDVKPVYPTFNFVEADGVINKSHPATTFIKKKKQDLPFKVAHT